MKGEPGRYAKIIIAKSLVLREYPVEKVASWSSPVFRAAVTEVMDGLQQSWRMPAPEVRLFLANRTSLVNPIALAKVVVGLVVVSLLITHWQFVVLVLLTLAVTYAFLRQLHLGNRFGDGYRHLAFLPLLIPIFISLGAVLGSTNLGTATPWLFVLLLAGVAFLILCRSNETAPGQTWSELLQELTVSDPLRQLIAIEALRQRARQGKLDPSQRQLLRHAFQLLLRQEIEVEVRHALLTALPVLSPRRFSSRLASHRAPLYLQPSMNTPLEPVANTTNA
jgi:hypothetical protein